MSASSQILDTRLGAHDQAVKLMASWIGAIADQVKNPVAGISAAAVLIEKEMASFRSAQQWDPGIVEEAVRLMLERLSRFDNYLSELSGFTRPVELDSKWFDLRSEWGSIVQLLARRISADFRIESDFDLAATAASPVMIYGDLERLRGIFSALVLNAVESCGSTINPEITVTVSAVPAAEGVVGGSIIRVGDNGPGFSKDALVQGLVPFYTTKEAGTGLGLAMVEKYVRSHGGWVKIGNRVSGDHHNEAPIGAVIELFFPSPESAG